MRIRVSGSYLTPVVTECSTAHEAVEKARQVLLDEGFIYGRHCLEQWQGESESFAQSLQRTGRFEYDRLYGGSYIVRVERLLDPRDDEFFLPVETISRRGDCLEEVRPLYEAAGRVFSLPPLEVLDRPELASHYLADGWLQWEEPFCGPRIDVAEGCEIRRVGWARTLVQTRTLRVYTEGGRLVEVRELRHASGAAEYEVVIHFATECRGPSRRAAADVVWSYPDYLNDLELNIEYAEEA